MAHSTITSKGQDTILAEIREVLSLKKDDKLVWKAAVERLTSPYEVFGILRQYARPGTTRQQQQAPPWQRLLRGAHRQN